MLTETQLFLRLKTSVKNEKNESTFNSNFNLPPTSQKIRKKEKSCPYGRKYNSTDVIEILRDRNSKMSVIDFIPNEKSQSSGA